MSYASDILALKLIREEECRRYLEAKAAAHSRPKRKWVRRGEPVTPAPELNPDKIKAALARIEARKTAKS